MSILIKGMKMPKGCYDCGFECRSYCFLMDEPVESVDRPAQCPLVEVPTPHGRLIDADKAKEALRRAEALTRAFGYHNVIDTISEVPTIIEAEEDSHE